MKYRLKPSTRGEQAYVRSIAREGPLQRVERGKARILSEEEYPEPIRRFLARERRLLRVKLSAAANKKLIELSRATGIGTDELARRWIERGIARCWLSP